MSNLTEYAKKELELAGWFKKDGMYDGMIGTAVMELVEKFSKQGHSGYSANLVLQLFNKVADFKPLLPIQGTDEEWNTNENLTGQNLRCSSIFKNKDGNCHYIYGLSFKTQNGNCWTGSAIDKNGDKVSSSQDITFPFIPKTFVIDVYEKEVAKGDYEFYIKDQEQLEEALKYFNGSKKDEE